MLLYRLPAGKRTYYKDNSLVKKKLVSNIPFNMNLKKKKVLHVSRLREAMYLVGYTDMCLCIHWSIKHCKDLSSANFLPGVD